jgi:hypothetical protein
MKNKIDLKTEIETRLLYANDNSLSKEELKRMVESIFDLMTRQKEELIEKVWDMLIMSLPLDAENLSTASELGWQSQAVLKNFMKKLNEI